MTDYPYELFLAKATESLAGAESECARQRYNNCANRCYYTCFQAAIAALILTGIRPSRAESQWRHSFVQAQFVGQLINRRKIYPSDLRTTLNESLALREKADYEPEHVNATRAVRILQRTRTFVEAVKMQRGAVG